MIKRVTASPPLPTVAPTRTVQPMTVAAPTPAGLRHALKGLDITDARIEIVGRRLYLRGMASCYRTKQIAGRRIAEAAPGVEVTNELRIAHGPASDEDVLRGVEAAIRRAAPRALRRAKARVEAGEVYISGTMRDRQERYAVETAAWQSPGVLRVINRTTVAGVRRTDGEISIALSSYVARALTLPYDGIRVTYRRGVATIYGQVATLQQREAIEELIRWHDHVRDVINHITIAPPPDAA